MSSKHNAAKIRLTDVELELMLILWQLGEASIKDILSHLPASRPMAYTSASTIVRILEKKGFVRSQKFGRGHLYQPLIDKSEYEAHSLNHMVENLFENTPKNLVARLLADETLSLEELQAMQSMLRKKLAQ